MRGYTITELLAVLFMLVVLPLLVFVIPLSFIWALNTLFFLGLPITFKTWTAALILIGIIQSSSFRKKDSK